MWIYFFRVKRKVALRSLIACMRRRYQTFFDVHRN